MASSTINIAFPPAMKAEVEKVVAKKGYGNTSEFFRDLFRNYLEEQQERRRIDALLLEGLNSGPATPLTKADFDDIRKRVILHVKKKG